MKKLEIIDIVIIVQSIVSIIFAFGYTEFPIIENNTPYLVIGLCIVGLGMYFLTYLKEESNQQVTGVHAQTLQPNPPHPHPLPQIGTKKETPKPIREEQQKDVFGKFNKIKGEQNR